MNVRGVMASIALLLFVNGSFAHTLVERMAVARALIEMAEQNDPGDDIEAGVEYPVNPAFCSTNGFFSLLSTNGWSVAECQRSFDEYLQSMSTNDCSHLSVDEERILRVAISLCRDLPYLQSGSAMQYLALNEKGVFRDEALSLGISFGSVNTQMTAFVERIVNLSRGGDSNLCLIAESEYADKLRSFIPSSTFETVAKSNAVNMLYRNRFKDHRAAMPLDRLFCASYAGYSMSSNRFATVCLWLRHSRHNEYLKLALNAITNELHSAAQPLAVVPGL